MSLEDLFDEVPRVTVSQYTRAIKKALEGTLPRAWVKGEISNLKRQSSGHIYFSLKDSGAQLPAVMFRGQGSKLRFVPRDGLQVAAFGEISVYEPHGRYQLVVRELEESGEGRLYQEFEKLKRKLLAEGLFDKERKKALPALPLKIAIVTSPTGAALQDFVRILARREWKGCLHVFPAKVQGIGSAKEIVECIRYANELAGYDAIVITRGGGSIEDLWSFNEEPVARAVSNSLIPVISGVGHEIDFTLCDLAADVRAETPSGAAEIIGSLFIETRQRLEFARTGLNDNIEYTLAQISDHLSRARERLKSQSPLAALEKSFLRMDELSSRFLSAFKSSVYDRRQILSSFERRMGTQDVSSVLHNLRERLERLERRLDRGLSENTLVRRRRLELLEATLKALSPENTLKRGYAMLEDDSGKVLTDARSIRSGAKVKATLSDGSLDLTVDNVKPR